MMIHTDDLARILEERDRELIGRLTKWFATVGKHTTIPKSEETCRTLAEMILVWPDRNEK